MKEYDNPENEASVTLDRRNWVRLLNAAHKGLDEIPDEREREHADDLLDEVIDQATITDVELIDLEGEMRHRV